MFPVGIEWRRAGYTASYLEKRAQPFKEKKLSLEVGKYGTMHHIKASQLKSQQSFLG